MSKIFDSLPAFCYTETVKRVCHLRRGRPQVAAIAAAPAAAGWGGFLQKQSFTH